MTLVEHFLQRMNLYILYLQPLQARPNDFVLTRENPRENLCVHCLTEGHSHFLQAQLTVKQQERGILIEMLMK